MSLTDPRLVLRQYFDPGADCKITYGLLTLEDGSLVTYEANYALSEQLLTRLFYTHKLDIIFIVDRDSVDPMITASGIIAYVHQLYVQPVIIDKWSSDGTMSVSATKLLNTAAQEIRRIIRANMSGSFKLSKRETSVPERLGTTILWGQKIAVTYTQFVTATGTYTVTDWRFFNYVAEWRVGATSSLYASVGPSSGILFAPLDLEDPWVKLKIPTGSTAVYQLLGNFDYEGTIIVHDYEAITVLLYETDVDNDTAGNQYAVSATGRTVIDYMTIVTYHTKINVLDDRSSPTTTYSFTNTRIGPIKRMFDEVASPWTVKFYADSMTQTDSA